MADQLEIDQLVDQIRSLVSALEETSKTGTTKVDAANNKLVAAIGQLVISLNKSSKSTAASRQSMDRFLKEIDDAAKAQEEQTKAVEERKKAEEELTHAHEEALKINTLSNEERKKQIAKDKKQSAFESLASKTKEAAHSREQKNWADVMNSMGNTATVGGLLKDRFESMGGTSLGATSALRLMSGVVEGLTAGLVEYGKAVYKGEIGATSAAKGVKTFTNTLGTVAQALGGFLLLVPGAQALGVGLIAAGTAAKTFGEVTEELAVVSDRLYNNYQDLSKVGVTASDGMIGLAESARKLGYGIDEGEFGLKKFNALMAKSSADLALLSASAIEGRKRFADIGGALADRGPVQTAFGNLGYSIDSLAEMSAKYIQQEVTLGRTQGKTDQQLIEGTKQYILLLDQQAKLTGQNVSALQDQMDANLRNERFQARLLELEAQGRTEEAQNLRLNMAAISKVAPHVAEGLMDLASGYPQTKKAQQAMLSGMSNVPREMERQLGGGFRELGDAAKRTTGVYGVQLGKVSQFGEVFGPLYEQVKLGTLSQKDFDAQLQKIIKEQKGQMEGAEGATGAATDLRTQTMQTRDAMQGFVLKGINPATEALGGLAGVINKITGVTPRAAVPTPSGAAAPGAAGPAALGRPAVGAPGAAAPSQGAAGPAALGRPAVGAPGAAAPGAAGPAALGRPAVGAPGAAAPSQGAGIRPTAEPTAAAASLSKIRELIAGVESRGDYNVVVGGAKYPLTEMTVADVMALQKKLIGEGKDSAAGKYQIKYSTLAGIMGQAGVGRGDKFDQITQDKLANALIIGRGFNQYAANPTKESRERFLTNLSREWAGLPAGPSGESYYKGVGNNKAGIGWEQALASFRTGGVATGPKSGYIAQLHGTEAVIPMPNGQSIKVDMPDFSSGISQQVQAMSAQITRLDELVSLMRNQNNISSKILQVSQA